MGFVMWSWFHWLFMLSPAAYTVAAHFAFRKSSLKTKRIAGIIMSAVAVALLFARNIEILVNNGWHIEPEVIPLQICHFANFVLLFAFIYNNKTLFALAFCLNLPAAAMSIVFADSLVNYTSWSIRGVVYIIGHMMIVGITLWAFVSDMIKLDRKTFLRLLILMLMMYLVSVPVNNILNNLMPGYTANYFYTVKPENGTPLEMFYNLGSPVEFWGMTVHPVYMLLTALLGFAVVSAFYGIYILVYRLKGRSARTAPVTD